MYLKTTMYFLGLTIVNNCFAQARLTMTGNSFIVIDNAAKLVVDNPASNAISNTGSGGIVTESEFDQVIWNIGASTGSYVMPFSGGTGLAQIPQTLTIGTAGVGAGSVRFSTYPAPALVSGFNNFLYRPSDVTHMGSNLFSATTNNSNNAIDRFWVIDPIGYGTKPAATMSFTYIDAEHATNGGNTLVEASLAAQRFNSTSGLWGDYLPQGTVNTAANTVSGAPASAANFFRSWTLSMTTHPLSSDVSYVKASCDGKEISMYWEAVNESSIDRYEIVCSSTGQIVQFVPNQNTIGGSVYNIVLNGQRQGEFSLYEVDQDGLKSEIGTINSNCGSTEQLVSYNSESNALYLEFEGIYDSEQNLDIYDGSGKLVYQVPLKISKGKNSLSLLNINLSLGLYNVRLQNGEETIYGKIISF